MTLKQPLLWLVVNLINHHVNSAQPSNTTEHPCLPPSADPSTSSEAAAKAENTSNTSMILQLFIYHMFKFDLVHLVNALLLFSSEKKAERI